MEVFLHGSKGLKVTGQTGLECVCVWWGSPDQEHQCVTYLDKCRGVSVMCMDSMMPVLGLQPCATTTQTPFLPAHLQPHLSPLLPLRSDLGLARALHRQPTRFKGEGVLLLEHSSRWRSSARAILPWSIYFSSSYDCLTKLET